MLAEHGWTVIIHANRSIEAAQDLARAVSETYPPSFALQADLGGERTADDMADGLMDRAVALTGRRPDLLVNNASVFDHDEASTQTRQMWDRQMAVNAVAPMMLSRAYFQRLPADCHGAIVNILDTKIFNLDGRFMSYEISKATLQAITVSTARGYAPRVRVNAVAPGLTLPSGRQSEADFAAAHVLNPLGHGATPEQVARAVLLFATTPGLTGQILAIDGGESLAGADPGVFDAM